MWDCDSITDVKVWLKHRWVCDILTNVRVWHNQRWQSVSWFVLRCCGSVNIVSTFSQTLALHCIQETVIHRPLSHSAVYLMMVQSKWQHSLPTITTTSTTATTTTTTNSSRCRSSTSSVPMTPFALILWSPLLHHHGTNIMCSLQTGISMNLQLNVTIILLVFVRWHSHYLALAGAPSVIYIWHFSASRCQIFLNFCVPGMSA